MRSGADHVEAMGAHPIEIAGGPFRNPLEEAAEIRFDPNGSATVLMGTHNHGQGHETSYRQIAATLLGLDPERVHIAFGDTDLVVHGRGTFGSRSMMAGGAAFAPSDPAPSCGFFSWRRVLVGTTKVGAMIVAAMDVAVDGGSIGSRSIHVSFVSSNSFSMMAPLLGGTRTTNVPEGPVVTSDDFLLCSTLTLAFLPLTVVPPSPQAAKAPRPRTAVKTPASARTRIDRPMAPVNPTPPAPAPPPAARTGWS